MNPIITASLTGPAATSKQTPAMPKNAAEIAEAAKGAFEAGAAVLHIHLRENDDFTADLDVAKKTVEAVREKCGGIIQLSTGGGMPYDERMKLVESKPAMATLNPASMTMGDHEFLNPPLKMYKMAERMLELGVKPEIEIYDTGHIPLMLNLVKKELVTLPLQVSFVMGTQGGMKADPMLLSYCIRELPEDTSWQVIAISKANLPMTTIGLAMGGNARVGLEDTIYIRPKELAESNAQLVEQLVGVAKSMNLQPAGVQEVIDRLKLSPELVNL